MIPKIIHYCWFGGKPLDKLSLKCIESWKKKCPDYEIRLWNEDNYDVSKNLYMKQAYDSKKWGFVPDYARLDIIYKYGGIYLDTDVEIQKSLDPLLNDKCFMGMEEAGKVALGLGFGAEPGCDIIKKMMDMYDDMEFIYKDGSYNLTPSPVFQTEVAKEYGFTDLLDIQDLGEVKVYPPDYFCGYDFQRKCMDIKSSNYTAHYYAGSWLPWHIKIRKRIGASLRRFRRR